MSRLHISTRGPLDWQSRLSDPEKQWRRGCSAFEAAVAWEVAGKSESGIPKLVHDLLAQEQAFATPKLILGLVEHKVALPHGSRASQNDVWALVSVKSGLLSLAVEAKAGEDFDATVEEWLAKSEPGSKKLDRLRYLLDVLGMKEGEAGALRYQLLHRAASAIIEAQRFNCQFAAVVVQSFENRARGTAEQRALQIEDFRAFSRRLGAEADVSRFGRARSATAVPLYLGWAACKPATDEECAAALGGIWE